MGIGAEVGGAVEAIVGVGVWSGISVGVGSEVGSSVETGTGVSVGAVVGVGSDEHACDSVSKTRAAHRNAVE